MCVWVGVFFPVHVCVRVCQCVSVLKWVSVCMCVYVCYIIFNLGFSCLPEQTVRQSTGIEY